MPPRRDNAIYVLVAGVCLIGCDLGVYEHRADADLAGADADPAAPDARPGAADARPGSPDAQPGSPDASFSATCDDQVSPVADGYHKRGTACLAGCHDNAYGSLPPFTLAGTLYSDAAGTATISGATLHAVDNYGNDVTIVTTDNGNFWTTGAVTFPVSMRASMCPDDSSMSAPVNSSGADCNAGGCHASGSRIHLP